MRFPQVTTSISVVRGVVHPAVWPDLANDIMHKRSLAEVGYTRDRSFVITERSLSSEITIVPRVSNGFCSRRTSNRRYALHAQRRHRHVNEHEAIIDLSITD